MQCLEHVARLPRLRMLNVYLCVRLSTTAVRRLQAQRPRLHLVG
jgi:hypothetical protein